MDCANWSLGKSSFLYSNICREKAKVSGDLDGDRVTGEVKGDRINFNVTDSDGRQFRYSAMVKGEHLIGSVDAPDTSDPKARVSHRFTAWRLP